ncbi:UPF0175 family protein [Thiomicrospira microaerophila]|uniref:UPF0175 family protein n=1 Tax=Thiomicrospira microaerophila TaxID=406020 RepID=UPI0005CA2D60|nr:UPF0175 family protein [Thiomicrospira microaerophila]
MNVTIDLPEPLIKFESVASIQKDIKLSYALWLFKQQKVTIAKAAHLAGLDLYSFMLACQSNDIPVIDISADALDAELEGL